MPTASIRADVVERLADLLRAHDQLQGVTVYEAVVVRDLAAECVMLGSIDTVTYEPADMRAGRQARNDTFAADVWFRSAMHGVADPREARRRAQTLFQAVDDVIADNPTLGGLPGVRAVTLTAAEGPDAFPTDQGFHGAMHAVAQVQTRLT